MESATSPASIAIARISRTRGNRGEVLAELHTDFPARFAALREVRLEFEDGRSKSFTVEDCWEHKGRQVLKFVGTDTISSAEKLVGAWILVEASRAVKLSEGTYFDHDLAGCALIDKRGAHCGTVIEVMRIEENNLLVVRDEAGEFLVPAKKAICREVSISRKEILVELPEGLVELNR